MKYRRRNYWKETSRIILFMLIVLIYFTTKIGLIIGVIHLFLALRNPKRFGMSRILIKILNQKKNFT